MEVLKVQEEDELEVSLELSIGGSCYKKSKLEVKKGGPFEGNDESVSRSDFYCGKMDLEKKRRIDDLGKQEGSEKDEIFERKKVKNGMCEAVEGLNCDLNGKNVHVENVGCVAYSSCEIMKNEDFCHVANQNGNGLMKRSSGGVSDNQNMSQKVQSSSDSGKSHSSISGTRQNERASRNDKADHLNAGGKVIPEQCRKVVLSSTSNTIEKPNHTNTSSPPPSKQLSQCLVKKPPKPPNYKIDLASVRHMPCVSTTGNGPNGKTVTGFLYKYNKTEVSIMCACHGRFFSPAEFVEHAGGVDILNPLRHITIVNTGLR